MSQFYPQPNSGQPPPQQIPGMRFLGYTTDGTPQYVPEATTQTAGAPPAAPPYQAPPPAHYPPQAPPTPQYAPPQSSPGVPSSYGPPGGGAPQGGGTIAFGEEAWSGGFPTGQFVVRIETIDAATSQQGNDKLEFHAAVAQPGDGVDVGRKHVWSYSLTEKAIGKLGRDVVNAGVNGQTRYPRDARGMAAALVNELRGVVVVIKVVEQKDSDLVNTSIVQRYGEAGAPGGGAMSAPVPTGPPAAPPQAAPPAQAPPAVSFPAGPPAQTPPPPSGGGGFANV